MFNAIKQLIESLPAEVDFNSVAACREARKVLQQIKVEAQKQRKEVILNQKNAKLNKV